MPMTDTNTKTFSFAGLELRCVTLDGEPWFAAADVCRCLGLRAGNTTVHTRNLSTSQVQTFRLPGSKGRANLIISEQGLYTLVMRAQKANPKAREFQDWVTGTVLPAIRKDGMYVQGEEKLDLSNDVDLAKMTLTVMEALQKKVEEAEARAAAATEKFEKAEPLARIGELACASNQTLTRIARAMPGVNRPDNMLRLVDSHERM